MGRTPTMKDVARAAGVSVMTVSRAFKRDASVGEATRVRIRTAADDLGYVFDSTAANLRSQRSHFVAVTIPSLGNANFADTVEAMTARLSQAGYQVLLGHTNYDTAREEELIEGFLSRRPEAIVVTGGAHTPRTRRLLSRAGVPVIETWDLPDDPIGHVVGFSNAAAVDLLVDHLTGLGHRRIAFIGGDAAVDTRGSDRRRGFVAAMAARGLDATRLIDAGRPPITMHGGAAAMARLLDTRPETDAVICVSDPSAFGALTECQRRGVAVPSDMAIAGFGAYDIADVSVPTLTTVDPCPAQIGARAAALVLDLLDRPDAPRCERITPSLRVGQSTAGA